jgi:hypothetical protein
LKKDARGLPIRFSGGSRNLFLHVREDCIDQLSNELRQRLAGAATVMTVPEACQAGMLGVTRVSEGLSERLGTLCCRYPRDGRQGSSRLQNHQNEPFIVSPVEPAACHFSKDEFASPAVKLKQQPNLYCLGTARRPVSLGLL